MYHILIVSHYCNLIQCLKLHHIFLLYFFLVISFDFVWSWISRERLIDTNYWIICLGHLETRLTKSDIQTHPLIKTNLVKRLTFNYCGIKNFLILFNIEIPEIIKRSLLYFYILMEFLLERKLLLEVVSLFSRILEAF